MSFSEMNEPTEPALSDFARLSIIHRMVRAGLDQSGSAADWKMILESHLGILRKNQADTPTFNFTQALRLVTLDAEFRDLCGDPFHGVRFFRRWYRSQLAKTRTGFIIYLSHFEI